MENTHRIMSYEHGRDFYRPPYKFNWRTMENSSLEASFIEGEDAERFLVEYNQDIDENFNGNPHLKFLEYTKYVDGPVVEGSNLFVVARIDSMLRRNGYRIPTLKDLSSKTILNMGRGCIIDTPALVLESLEDEMESKKLIIKRDLAEYVDTSKIKETPALITGFDIAPSLDGYCGLKIIPRDDFKVIYDERLTEYYEGAIFSKVDELGLPLFDKNGGENKTGSEIWWEKRYRELKNEEKVWWTKRMKWLTRVYLWFTEFSLDDPNLAYDPRYHNTSSERVVIIKDN